MSTAILLLTVETSELIKEASYGVVKILGKSLPIMDTKWILLPRKHPSRMVWMVPSLLHAAGLGPEYWSFALLHAVFIKNWICHSSMNQVPYTEYTGTRPSAKRLRVYGCPVIVCNVGPGATKFDINTTVDIFMVYMATDKNVIYMDSVTKQIKTATHFVFDEAGFSLPSAQLTPSARALQQLGYVESTDQSAPLPEGVPPPQDISATPTPVIVPEDITSMLQVKCLSLHSTILTRAADGSTGYDLYSAVDTIVLLHTRSCVLLDVIIIPPTRTYGQNLSHSGLAAEHSVDVKAGTINRDYTGNILVLLENNSDKPFTVDVGNWIAQLVLYNIQTPKVSRVVALLPQPSTDNMPLTNLPCIRANAAVTEVEKPYEIYFSHDPFHTMLEIDITVEGDHPTLGILSQYCSSCQRLQIKDVALGTPGS